MKNYLLKGDINGIQNFIYNVYEGKGGVAKILRARSFYISILPDVVIKYIKDRMGKNWQCEIVLNGGGGFILRIKTNQEKDIFEKELENIRRDIESFLLRELHGEIGITFGYIEEKWDNGNFDSLNKELDAEKRRKFKTVLDEGRALSKSEDGVFFLEEPGKTKSNRKCVICRTFFEENTDICNFCKGLKKLGTLLPRSLEKEIIKRESKDKTFQFIIGERTYFLHLNNKCKGNKNPLITVPLLKRDLTVEDIEKYQLSEDVKDLEEGLVAPFEVIALYAKGDKKLGYLIMDVDNLGLLFGKISNVELQEAVSKRIDRFFKEKVSEIAIENFKPRDNELGLLDKTEIYILYAGGDDLFAIGPWDRLLDFAVMVNEAFEKFAKSLNEDREIAELLRKEKRKDKIVFYQKNKNGEKKGLSLSAGFVAVKPKFTVRMAARMCQDEEKRAKNGGKDSIGAFRDVLSWETVTHLIDECKNKWIPYVEEEEIPRRFFYRLYKLYLRMMERESKDMSFYPLMHYTIARTIKNEQVRNEVIELVNSVENRKVKFLCNYILTATRGRK